MKLLRTIIPILLAFPLVFVACIQKEPLNLESDIVECTVPDLPENAQYGAQIIKPNKGDNQIIIQVAGNYKVGVLSPEFVLTPGATISPASGTSLDFSDEQAQTYTVTSENGQWEKEYTILFLQFELTPDENGDGRTKSFDFEDYQTFDDKNFHQFYETSALNTKYSIWASGNIGFSLTNVDAPAESYPTFATNNGKTGSAVQLVTRSTGALGASVGKPIASGNLFLGTFDVSQALTNAMQATQFGIPYTMNEPVEITFWYKFQGGTFTDSNGAEQQDFPSIYAVLFEPEEKDNGEIVLLNGANVLSADNIIMAAELDPTTIIRSTNIETAEFAQGSIQFVPRKAIDAQKLANGAYYITIVFASSCRGDLFEGFVGNTLIIDEVKLITAP